MKRGRKFRWLLIALLLASVVTSWWWFHEPRHQGRTVSAWLNDLDSKSDETVEQAEAALKTLGTNALPTLIWYLGAKDSPWKIKLIEWAHSPAWMENQFLTVEKRRDQARRAFYELGEIGLPAVPRIVPLLVDEDISWDAAKALESIGPAGIDALLPFLTNGHPRIRAHVCDVLGRFSEQGARIVPALKSTLRDDADEVRASALSSLCLLKPKPEDMLPLLVPAMQDPAESIRISALALSLRTGSNAFPVVLLALQDKSASVRCQAVNALDDPGPVARLLMNGLKSSTPPEFAPAMAVPVLLGCLSDPSPEVRQAAIVALARRAPDATSAVPALLKLTEDTAPTTDSLIYSRLKIADPSVPLREYPLYSTNIFPVTVGDAAKYVLTKIDPAAGSAIYLSDLKLTEVPLRLKAAFALGELKIIDDQVVQGLMPLLQDQSVEVRTFAIQALGELGPAAHAAVPALKALAEDRTLLQKFIFSAVGSRDFYPIAIDPITGLRVFPPTTKPQNPTAIGDVARDALKQIDPNSPPSNP